MTAHTSGARASRRSAATAARNGIKTHEPEVVSEALEDTALLDDEAVSAAADEAFGPDDVDPSPQATTQVIQRPAFVQVRSNPSSANGSIIALPMQQEDLTRKLDAGDLIIPKLRLVQAMSKTNMLYQTSKGKEGVQQGNWYHSTSGENLGETVYFIPVDMRKSRAYFVQGQGLMCRSFDLLNGEGDPGMACEGDYNERLTVPADRRGCPLRLWKDNAPPKCGVTYNYPGLIIRESEIDDPEKIKPLQGMLQLRSTASQAAKAINTMMGMEGGGIWHNLIIELGVDVRTNPRGTFYVPSVDFYDTTDAAGYERVQRRAASMARQMGNQNLRPSIEDDDS